MMFRVYVVGRCERDYVVLGRVAEVWNTLTSLLYLAPATLGYYCHRHLAIKLEFKLIFLSMALLAIGSALFHGTLRYSMQVI